MTTKTTTAKRTPSRYVPPEVPIQDRLRWSIGEAAAMVSRAESVIRDLERKGLFPPRVRVVLGTDVRDQPQFIAAEVRAWAEGRDWRSMVSARSPEAASA